MCASSSISPYDVNRCDPTEMRLCRPQLHPHIQRLADATDYRIRRFPQRFAREDQHYAENANILLLSGFVGKDWYFKCGLLKHTCGNWRACPACCHRKRMTILSKFLPVFGSCAGQFGFVTLSSKRPHYCGDGYCDNLELIWDACRFGFEIMTDLGEFDAVFLLEEFQILSYWPVPMVVAHGRNHSQCFSSRDRLKFGENIGMVGVKEPDDFGVVQKFFDVATGQSQIQHVFPVC